MLNNLMNTHSLITYKPNKIEREFNILVKECRDEQRDVVQMRDSSTKQEQNIIRSVCNFKTRVEMRVTKGDNKRRPS